MRNLHCRFDRYYIGQIYGEDFAEFCGLLRIYKLYQSIRLSTSSSVSVVYVLILSCSSRFTLLNCRVWFLTSTLSLNTQSGIKGLLVVRDFCFRAVWADGPVHKTKLGADYEQLLRAVFSCLRGHFFWNKTGFFRAAHILKRECTT